MDPITPQAILNLAHKFTESRILLTGAELDLFTLLSPSPLPTKVITARIKGDLRAVTILLDALTAMNLLVKDGEKYSCPPPLSRLLSKTSPDSVLPMLLHMAHLWKRWSDLTPTVSPAFSAGEDVSPAEKDDELRAFIGAMHSIGAGLAPAIVAAIDPGDARALLDVGGGSGTYTIAFLNAAPRMKATLFDRPEVIEMARQRLREAGLLRRVSLVGGDFSRDEFPPGHDLALLSAIIHQNSPEENSELYGKIFRSLRPGGRIVIRDHVMEPDRTRPRDGAIFAVNMLMGTRGGNTYTFEEIRSGLERAGFVRIRLLQKGEHMDGLVEGFKDGPSGKGTGSKGTKKN
jgi:predicted O-methyltransferase YrrM